MVCQPAWQLAITTGLPLAWGWRRASFLDEQRLCVPDILDGLIGHGFGEEADEVAGVPRGERDANFAVLLHSADAGAMTGTRIDDDERPFCRIGNGAGWRNYPHQPVSDRTVERSSVEDKLNVEVQNVRGIERIMLMIIIAALAKHIEEKGGALRGILKIFERGPQGRCACHFPYSGRLGPSAGASHPPDAFRAKGKRHCRRREGGRGIPFRSMVSSIEAVSTRPPREDIGSAPYPARD